MPIKFNTILMQAALDPTDVVLLRHQDTRSLKGRSPYHLWRDDRALFDSYQSTQSFDNRARLTRAHHWASFVGTPDGDTMFVGVYHATYRGLLEQDQPWPNANRIDLAGSCDVYDLIINDAFYDLPGKLFIDWGEGLRAWIQRADRQNKDITELRREFKEESFPGFLNFMQPLSKIESLPLGWVTTLKASRGIYLLTCPKTMEQYVGKASGSEGFWHRWLEYVQTGHGDNVALKSREPSDYRVSILEVAGTAATEEEIGKMETRWKEKLQSKEMGLNRN
jgi:hypothetical protein